MTSNSLHNPSMQVRYAVFLPPVFGGCTVESEAVKVGMFRGDSSGYKSEMVF